MGADVQNGAGMCDAQRRVWEVKLDDSEETGVADEQLGGAVGCGVTGEVEPWHIATGRWPGSCALNAERVRHTNVAAEPLAFSCIELGLETLAKYSPYIELLASLFKIP
jgi:hypothetical protein